MNCLYCDKKLEINPRITWLYTSGVCYYDCNAHKYLIRYYCHKNDVSVSFMRGEKYWITFDIYDNKKSYFYCGFGQEINYGFCRQPIEEIENKIQTLITFM